MTKRTKDTDAPALETVMLFLPHTHGGIDYQRGETIDVTKAQAEWLQERGIIAAKELPIIED